jgi:AraC-like DNA-binding protein
VERSFSSAPVYDWPALARKARFRKRKLAQLAGMSLSTLERRLRREFDTTPQAWLDALRLKEAEKLLRAGKPVKAVAYELFYKQASHFCRQFKQSHGLSAQCWRKRA